MTLDLTWPLACFLGTDHPPVLSCLVFSVDPTPNPTQGVEGLLPGMDEYWAVTVGGDGEGRGLGWLTAPCKATTNFVQTINDVRRYVHSLVCCVRTYGLIDRQQHDHPASQPSSHPAFQPSDY